MRVMVIDDNPDDRRLAIRELCAVYPGARAVEVLDQAELDRELAAGAPDLVVTDLHAKWIFGLDVLRRVKLDYPDVPVIMFTGTGSEEVAVEAMHEGLDDYVVKSARQLPRLRASIRQVVEGAERKRRLREREAELEAAVAHKELVLRELHHRVKNNLQIVNSILMMRARRAADPRLASELNEVAGQMAALAGVQARILDSGALDRVDFRAVLNDISRSLGTVHADSHIAVATCFDGELVIEVSRALPLALLVYEILLNACKHAYPEGRRGTIHVHMLAAGERPEIIIADDGVGFEEAHVQAGVGYRLVRGLAAEARVEVVRTSKPGLGTTLAVRLLP